MNCVHRRQKADDISRKRKTTSENDKNIIEIRRKRDKNESKSRPFVKNYTKSELKVKQIVFVKQPFSLLAASRGRCLNNIGLNS